MEARKDKLGPLVPADYIKRLRLSLGLTQVQFAVLLEVGNVTVSHWEKDGMDGARSSSYVNFKTLVGLLRQALTYPEVLNPDKLVRYLDLASRHELVPYYLSHSDMLVPELLNVINSGSVTGVVLALLLDLELAKRGRPTPYEVLSSLKDRELPLECVAQEEDDLLNKVERCRKKESRDKEGLD